MKEVAKLFVSVGASFLAGAVGSIFTAPAITGWYEMLEKPALNPPSWVFGPAWTTLYLLMGIAAFLVWRRGFGRRDVKIALLAFAVQLVLNAIWSILFFGLRSPGWALAEIIVLWAAIITTTILFRRVSRPAAYLMLPYILWVAFAAYLNWAIWTLN
mgnify:CR=1 FL=1